MNKTIKVNLNSIAFHIDEDAYHLLNEYLTSVKTYFSKQQDSQNILEDIEARIAELFQSKLGDSKQVININDVHQVIGMLGTPSDFGSEEDQKTEEEPSWAYKKSKRLYRDRDDSLLGGVGSGLGAYLNIDPLWPRIAFILLFFASGFGVILYIVLWIIVPPARTTAEKLEMKGESITLENLEKSFQQEYEKVKINFKNYRNSEQYKSFTESLSHGLNAVGRFLLELLKVVGVLLGVVLVIAGILLLLSLTGIMFFDFQWLLDLLNFRFTSLPEILQHYSNSEDVTLLLLSIFLVIVLPILALIYGGIKLAFNIKSRNRSLGLGIFVLWLLSALFAIYTLFLENHELKYKGQQTHHQSIPHNQFQSLYVTKNRNFDDPELLTQFIFSKNQYGFGHVNGEKVLYSRPRVEVKPSSDSLYRLTIVKESWGLNAIHADTHARQIKYNYSVSDSTLILDPFFIIQPNARWTLPGVRINLYVPLGRKISFSHGTKDLIDFIRTAQGPVYTEFTGENWVMLEDGLMTSTQ